MTRTISIQDLQTQTDQLLTHLAPGDEIIVAQDGKPLAHITPASTPPANQTLSLFLGSAKGGFDSPAQIDAFLSAERDSWQR